LPAAGIFVHFYFSGFKRFLLQFRLWNLKHIKREKFKKILSARTAMDELIPDHIS